MNVCTKILWVFVIFEECYVEFACIEKLLGNMIGEFGCELDFICMLHERLNIGGIFSDFFCGNDGFGDFVIGLWVERIVAVGKLREDAECVDKVFLGWCFDFGDVFTLIA